MALESTDVFVVQKQDGNKENRKLSFQQLQDALGAGPSVVFKGVKNMTDAATQPTSSANGDLYINDTAGTFAWTTGDGYTGAVSVDARAIWTGTGWSVTNPPSGDVGVEEVKATAPVTVDSADASSPIIGINDAATSSDGATQTSGVVTIATNADVTTGTANVVVTAAQLKTTNDSIANAGGGTVTSVTGVAPIVITDGTAATTPQVTISAADADSPGSVQLINAGLSTPDTTSTSLAIVPKYLAGFYLVKDFSSLTDVDA